MDGGDKGPIVTCRCRGAYGGDELWLRRAHLQPKLVASISKQKRTPARKTAAGVDPNGRLSTENFGSVPGLCSFFVQNA
jgi:hypothetical protein